MKRFVFAAVLITSIASFILLRLDSQSEQGLLNAIFTKNTEKSTLVKSGTEEAQHASTEETAEEATVDTKNTAANQEQASQPKQSAAASASQSAVITGSFIICIDPGHQEKANLEQEPFAPGESQTKYKVTGGTTGVSTNKPEYVLNLEASQILKNILEKKGFQVIMTRTSHNVDLSNQERAEIANRSGADLFIRLHADGSENTSTKGFSILVPAKDSPYTKTIYDDSYQAANFILTHVSKEIPIHQGGIFQRSDMTGFNWSRVPVILPEIGFMSNPEEDQKLSDSKYLTNLMELMAAGIEEYALYKQR